MQLWNKKSGPAGFRGSLGFALFFFNSFLGILILHHFSYLNQSISQSMASQGTRKRSIDIFTLVRHMLNVTDYPRPMRCPDNASMCCFSVLPDDVVDLICALLAPADKASLVLAARRALGLSCLLRGSVALVGAQDGARKAALRALAARSAAADITGLHLGPHLAPLAGPRLLSPLLRLRELTVSHALVNLRRLAPMETRLARLDLSGCRLTLDGPDGWRFLGSGACAGHTRPVQKGPARVSTSSISIPPADLRERGGRAVLASAERLGGQALCKCAVCLALKRCHTGGRWDKSSCSPGPNKGHKQGKGGGKLCCTAAAGSTALEVLVLHQAQFSHPKAVLQLQVRPPGHSLVTLTALFAGNSASLRFVDDQRPCACGTRQHFKRAGRTARDPTVHTPTFCRVRKTKGGGGGGFADVQLGRVDLPALRELDVRGASLARQRPSPVPGFEVTWLPVAAVVAGCPRLRALSWTRQHWDRAQCQELGCALPVTLERITVQVTLVCNPDPHPSLNPFIGTPRLHHGAGPASTVTACSARRWAARCRPRWSASPCR